MVDPDPDTPRRPRIALVHDWLCGHRGGEAVLERAARVAGTLGEVVGVFTMFDDGRGMGSDPDTGPRAPTVDALPHVVSAIGRLPGASGRLRRALLPLFPIAGYGLTRALAREHRARGVDLVLSTSSAWVKNVRPPRGVAHVCYCHAPMRYIWSRLAESAPNAVVRVGLRTLAVGLRPLDRRGTRTVDRFLANSGYIASEIGRCYGELAAARTSVLHPPVRTGFFTPGEARPDAGEGYWLVGGALEAYKRTELAIEAARLAGRRIIVFGDGSARAGLERRFAGERVEFVGRVGDARLRELFRSASVYLFPQVEDFGITAAEAQACGCPVAARRAGGAIDLVIEGETGAMFDATGDDARDAAALAEAASRAEACDAGACRRHAETFSEARFDAALETVLREVLEMQPQAGTRSR